MGDIAVIPLIFTIVIVVATIGLGLYVQGSVKTAADMYVASRNVSVGMNAAAISGEYLSAASFMGVAGMIMKSGYDVLWYPVCYAAGYLFLLLFIAGPLRRFGAYTIPDFAEGRYNSPLFRKIAVIFVLIIGFFYTMPQMKGAGTTLVNILNTPYWVGVVLVGAVITFNVSLGGMKGITFVQAFQYWTKMFAISVPMVIIFMYLGSYSGNLDNYSVDKEAGKALPKFKHDSTIGYKNDPLVNGITFPTAITGKFETDADVVISASKTIPADADKVGAAALVTSALPTQINEEKKPDGKVVKHYIFKAGTEFTTGKAVEVTKGGEVVKTKDSYGNEVPLKVTAKFVVTPTTVDELAVKISYKEGQVVPNAPNDRTWLMPFGSFTNKYGHPLLYTYSLIVALICGTAGLPHILVRFYTNPDGKSAKRTTFWVMILIGAFYIFTPMFAAIGRTWVPELYAVAGGAKATDSVVLILPRVINNYVPMLGDILSGITSAGAFAAFMSTFSGLLVSMTGALAHDVYGTMINPKASVDQRMRAFKVASVIAGTGAVILGIFVETFDINMLVGWAFAIAAASYFPMLLISAWWKRATAIGAGAGMLVGGGCALAAIGSTMIADKFAPSLKAWYALHPILRTLAEQPAIWALPFSLGLIFVVSLATQDRVPADINRKMLVLHAPEELGLKGDYIKDDASAALHAH